ncbi:hypothetical protein NKDENANG_01900 [Candidatus Entotheonellaceae bacterium PAL068K]
MRLELYIAGPLFTPYHRAFHAETVRCLREAGHACFVPQEQEHNAPQTKSAAAQVGVIAHLACWQRELETGQ